MKLDPTFWCTCALCRGRWYACLTEWHAEHREVTELLDSEVTIEQPPEREEWDGSPIVFTGTCPDDDLSVLIQMYPADGVAEVSFRQSRWDTWGPPTVCKAEQG